MKKVVLQLWIGLEVEDAIATDMDKVRNIVLDRLILEDNDPYVVTELASSLQQVDQPAGEPWVWF